MEHHKFAVNDIQPLMLYVISKDECILICLLYQELDDKHLYSETKIKFSSNTPLEVGSKINLIGDSFKQLIKQKINDNTILSGFNGNTNPDNKYYYKCYGYTQGDETVDLIIPRHIYVKIKYLTDSIMINGGFPKSARYMFSHDINFIRIEKVELYGSKVIDHKDNISIVKNAFILICGPKKYTVTETIGVAKYIEDLDLRIPVPEYVFTKVYVNQDEVSRLILEDGERLLIQFNRDRDTITVYSINDIENINKLSTNYWIKGGENEDS